jgi:hypothetical protein
MRTAKFDPSNQRLPDDGMHPLSERAFEVMESAGIEQALIDEICNGIDILAGMANRECPACERRAAELEQRAWDEAEKLAHNSVLDGK